MQKMKKIYLLLLLLLFSTNALAVFEISGGVGYQKQKYGENKEDSTVERNYSGSIAIYLFSLTAIELNYYFSEKVVSTKQDADPTQSFSLIESQNRIQTDVYGIGIRQALAGRKSRVRPMLSLGYAKQFVNDSLDYTFQETATNSNTIVNLGTTKYRDDSVFGTFTLQLRLTRGLSLNASVKTIFPAFEFDRASDDMKYSFGFSWYL